MRKRRTSWVTPGYTTVDQLAAILACLTIAVVCAGAIVWMSIQ